MVIASAWYGCNCRFEYAAGSVLNSLMPRHIVYMPFRNPFPWPQFNGDKVLC